ncbi:MAG: 16S rRNA (uracil(1498)-N(3))-methyltransferase [Pseudomonadota bacterium]|nr:16S rRNA (uracil(1498)-N(3))-methyltransferase [Pseudomonadota bacterium]
MNIILLEQADWLSHDQVALNDRRYIHLRDILKTDIGAMVKVGMLNGDVGTGEVTSIDNHGARLRVTLDQAPPPRHPSDIVLSLPRPKMLRRVLRTVAEMGVSTLHLVNSARVEKSFWQSPLLEPERIDAALRAGLERSADTRLPSVHLHPLFRPFVEDKLPGLMRNRGCWIAHPGASHSLADQASGGIVMLGPEGGFVPFEVELAQAQGARPVHIGARILSVDTAVTAALSQTMVRVG